MLFINFLCLYCLIVLATCYTISKSISHENNYDEPGKLREYDYLSDYAPRYERHNKPRKEERIHRATKQVHGNQDTIAATNSQSMSTTAKRNDQNARHSFTSLWKNLKHKKITKINKSKLDPVDSKNLYDVTQLENPNMDATSIKPPSNQKKSKRLSVNKRELETSTKAFVTNPYKPTAYNFRTVNSNLHSKSGKLYDLKPNSQVDSNNLVNVDGKTVCVISDFSNPPTKQNVFNLTATDPIIMTSTIPLPTAGEGDNTARIEDLLNSIKAKVVEILADRTSHLHEAKMVSNPVTITTYMDPSLFVGFTSMPLTNEPSTYKEFDFNITSLSGDNLALQARCRKDLKCIKEACSKIIHKVSNDFKNEVRETVKAIESFTHSHKSTTEKKCKDKQSSKKKDCDCGLVQSSKATIMTKQTSDPTITTVKTTALTVKSTKRNGKKVRQANETISRILKHVRRHKLRTTHSTSPKPDDDYILLSLYEQMLTKSDQVNRLGVTAPVKRSYNSEKALLSKRNTETLTDLSLKENIQDIINDGEVMPDISESVHNNENTNIQSNSITTKDEKSTEPEMEDITIEGLSNKLSYKDYINGYKYYLKFQKDLKKENFSDLVKYQAHRHHKVDDIGKYILEKLPQVPKIGRSKRRFFDDDTMDDQDVSTRNDDSWFKKHFYFFIDNGPPKKFHTSQTVSLKSHGKSDKNAYGEDFSSATEFHNSKKHIRRSRGLGVTTTADELVSRNLTYLITAVTRSSRENNIIKFLDKVAIWKPKQQRYTTKKKENESKSPTTKRMKRNNRVTIRQTTDGYNATDPCNGSCDDISEIKKNDKQPCNNKKDKPQENKDDAIILSNCKKRDPENNLTNVLDNVKNENSKIKRSLQSKPQRFNAFKHLKNIFLGETSEETAQPEPYYSYPLDNQLSMYKVPNVDTLFNQIPNITDADTGAYTETPKKPPNTDFEQMKTLKELWTPKFAKLTQMKHKTTASKPRQYKKPRARQFFPMSRFVTSKFKDETILSQYYFNEDYGSKYKPYDSPLPRFSFNSKDGRTKTSKSTTLYYKLSMLHDIMAYNTLPPIANYFATGYGPFEKYYRMTNTKSSRKGTRNKERHSKNKNRDMENHQKYRIVNKNDPNIRYVDYAVQSPYQETEPILRMFEKPGILPEHKSFKPTTKKLYEVSRITTDDETDADLISQSTPETTTLPKKETHKLPHKKILYDHNHKPFTSLRTQYKTQKIKTVTPNHVNKEKTQRYQVKEKINEQKVQFKTNKESKDPLEGQNKAYNNDDILKYKDTIKDSYNEMYDAMPLSSTTDDLYSSAPEQTKEQPFDFEDFYIMNSDILQTDKQLPTWRTSVEQAAKHKLLPTTPDNKKMLKEVDEITDTLNMDFDTTTIEAPKNEYKNKKLMKSNTKPQAQHETTTLRRKTSKHRQNVKIVHYTLMVNQNDPKVKRLVTNPLDATKGKFKEAKQLFKQMKGTKNEDAMKLYESEVTKNNFQTSDSVNRMLVDTTLLAYDDGADVLTKEQDSESDTSKSDTKKNTPPKQFFSTPVPMKDNDFENFLKENYLDLFSLTSPLENVPRLHSFDLKHRLYANPTKIIKTDRHLSKDSQKANVNSMASKTNKIKQFFHMTTPTNITDSSSNITEMTKVTLFRDTSLIRTQTPKKRNNVVFRNKPNENLDEIDNHVEDDIFSVAHTVASTNSTYDTRKRFNSTNGFQNPAEDITERSPNRNHTKVMKTPQKSKHIRYKTYKKTNPRVLYPLPLSEHRIVTRKQSSPEPHNSLLFNEGVTIPDSYGVFATKDLHISEASTPDHEFTTFYSHHGPPVKVGKGKKPHPKQVLFSDHVCKFDVPLNDHDVMPKRRIKSDYKTADLESPNYSVTKIKALLKLNTNHFTKANAIYIDLPTYYQPNREAFETNLIIPKKLSWHDHIVRCISGLALVELLNKYGFIKTVEAQHDKNLNSNKVFSENHPKRYMEMTTDYDTLSGRHGRYLQNDLFKKLQATRRTGRTAHSYMSTPIPYYDDDIPAEDILMEENEKTEKDEGEKCKNDKEDCEKCKKSKEKEGGEKCNKEKEEGKNCTKEKDEGKKCNKEKEEGEKSKKDKDGGKKSKKDKKGKKKKENDEDEHEKCKNEEDDDEKCKKEKEDDDEKCKKEKEDDDEKCKKEEDDDEKCKEDRDKTKEDDFSKEFEDMDDFGKESKDEKKKPNNDNEDFNFGDDNKGHGQGHLFVPDDQIFPTNSRDLLLRTEEPSRDDNEEEEIDDSADDIEAKRVPVTYLPEPRDDFNINFEKIIIEKGFQAFSKKRKDPPPVDNLPPPPKSGDNMEDNKNTKKAPPYQTHRTRDPYIYLQEPTQKPMRNESEDHLTELHKELEQIYKLHEEVLGKIKYLRNKFRTHYSGNRRMKAVARKKREKSIERPKRDTPRTYRAKDVSALEVIVDLVKEFEPDSQDLKPLSKKSIIGTSDSDLRFAMQNNPQGVADNSSLELHICIPSDFGEDRKRASNPLRVRKVFSAIMSTPVDIEYQIQSFVDEPITTTPTVIEETIKVSPTTPVNQALFEKIEQTAPIDPAIYYKKQLNTEETKAVSTLSASPSFSSEVSVTDSIVSSVRAYTLTTPTKIFTLALTGASPNSPLLTSAQKSVDDARKAEYESWQHVTMRGVHGKNNVIRTSLANDSLRVSVPNPTVTENARPSPTPRCTDQETIKATERLLDVLVSLSNPELLNTATTLLHDSEPQPSLNLKLTTNSGASSHARRSSSHLGKVFSTEIFDKSELMNTTKLGTQNIDIIKPDYDEEYKINETLKTADAVFNTESAKNRTFDLPHDNPDYNKIFKTNFFGIHGNTNTHSLKTKPSDFITPKTEKFMPLSMPAEEIPPPNITTSRADTSGRVTLSKEFIEAVDDRVIQLFINLTKLQNQGLLHGAKVKRDIEKMHELDWKKLKKIFKRDASCHSKSKYNNVMCRSCTASDAVLTHIVSEFDNLARFLDSHCSEMQAYLCKNPTGRRKLRDILHRIDSSLNSDTENGKFDKRYQNVTDQNFNADNVDMKNDSNDYNFQQLFSLSNNLNKAINLDVCPNKNLTDSAKTFYEQAKSCLMARNTPNDEMKNVYSLDKINVNIICKGNEPHEKKNLETLLDTKELDQGQVDINIPETTYPTSKKGKGIKNLFFFKSGTKQKQARMNYPRNYLNGRDNGVWFPALKTKKKRNTDYINQLEPPIITDSGGSFWHEYINNDNRNGRASARNYISRHSPKIKKHLFKSHIRQVHTPVPKSTLSTGYMEFITTVTDVPNIDEVSHSLYNINIFGTVSEERSESTSTETCICAKLKTKTKTPKFKFEAKSTSKRWLFDKAEPPQKVEPMTKEETTTKKKTTKTKTTETTRRPKTTHSITTTTTMSSTKINTAKKKDKYKRKSTTTIPKQTITSDAPTSFFSRTPTSQKTTAKSTVTPNTASSQKLWKKILSSLDFYHKTNKANFYNENLIDESMDSTEAFDTVNLKRSAKTVDPNQDGSNLLLSIYLYKKRRQDDELTSKTSDTLRTPLPFNTMDLIKESARLTMEKVSETEATTTKSHGLSTIYPEIRAILNKIKSFRNKVASESKEKDEHLNKRTEGRPFKGGTEEPDLDPVTKLICDLPATGGHIIDMYIQLPQNSFEYYIKTIECYKYRSSPKFLRIKKLTSKMPRKIFKPKRTDIWNWIRKKRSIRIGQVKKRDDLGAKERGDFEEFVRDDSGVYKVKFEGRKKRQSEDLVDEVNSLDKEIFAHLGDTIEIKCEPDDSSPNDGKASWVYDKQLFNVGNVDVRGNVITLRSVRAFNDGEYYCKTKDMKKRLKLTVITLPSINIVYIPVYSSTSDCGNITKSFVYLDSLAREMSTYLCPSSSHCTVNLHEPFCVRDPRFNKAHIQSTAIVTMNPPPLTCSVECRKGLLSALSSLSATNFKHIFNTPVVITIGEYNDTLYPASNKEVYGFWRHSLIPYHPNNEKVQRFGNYQLAKRANAFIMKSIVNMVPGHVRVLASCRAGQYLVRRLSVCAMCPANSWSLAGQNYCVSNPRDTRNMSERYSDRMRRFGWHGKPLVYTLVCVLCVCAGVAAGGAWVARGRGGAHRGGRGTTIATNQYSTTSTRRRPLSPSRVILTRLFNSSAGRNHGTQEDKFKMWKLRNSRPPVPPVDFDW